MKGSNCKKIFCLQPYHSIKVDIAKRNLTTIIWHKPAAVIHAIVINVLSLAISLDVTPASANESPATFVLAGIVAISGLLNLLLISLVILLFYKYKRAKQSHDVMGTQDIVQAIATDINLNENQAWES